MSWRELAAPGLKTLREFRAAFWTLQAFGLLAGLAYYLLPGVRLWADGIGAVKAQWGYGFSAGTTALASVGLPLVARRLTRLPGVPPREILFQIVYFAVVGVAVDALYRGLGLVFGDRQDPGTVVLKVLADQLLFSPLVSLPYAVVAWNWRDAGFSWTRARARLANGGFLRRLGPLVVLCWAFWTPLLLVLYALPGGVQFLLFLFLQAAYALLLVPLARREELERVLE